MIMWMSNDAGPDPYTMVPGVRYRRLTDRPDWEADLRLDLLLPRRPAGTRSPTIVYLHGGGWWRNGREHGLFPWTNPLLAANGYVTASVSYRLSDVDPFPAQLDDALAAIAWLRSPEAEAYGIDHHRIGVWGDSAGGHLALLLGCQPPDSPSAVQAVIGRGAPSDFETFHTDDEDEPGSIFHRLFGGPNSDAGSLRRSAGALHRLAGLDPADLPPFLLVHGDQDETVPFEQSRRFVDAVTALGGRAELRVVEGGHHNFTDDPHLDWTNDPWEQLGREALAFFDHTLR